MSAPPLLELFLLRQRRTFVTVLASAFLVVVLVTLLLPKQYSAEATLFVGENRPLAAGASAVQLDEVLARTYVSLLRTPDVERAVVRALPFEVSPDDLEEKVDIEVVTGTRLIEMAALDRDADRARRLADTYAQTFVERQRSESARLSRDQQAALQTRIGELAQEVERLTDSTVPADIAARARAETELQASRDAFVATQQSLSLQGSNVSLASRAPLPSAPAKPRPKLYLAFGALLSLALAAGAALLRDRFDDRLHDEDELLRLVDAPVLAHVPVERVGSEREVQEAFDVLHANLRAGDHEGERGIIAITSAMPEEGKTFTVVHLAAAFARLGTSVLAVECDLRRPMLATHLHAGGTKGLTNLLVEAPRDPEELVVPTSIRGVRLLGAGPLAPSPAALLGMARLRDVLDGARPRYEQLLLDAPPVTVGADMTALAPAADGVILVVDLQRARRRALVAAGDQLARSGTPLVGVVLNRARSWNRGYGLLGYGAYRPAMTSSSNGAGSGAGVAERVEALREWARRAADRLGRREQPAEEARRDR